MFDPWACPKCKNQLVGIKGKDGEQDIICPKCWGVERMKKEYSDASIAKCIKCFNDNNPESKINSPSSNP